MVRQAFVGLELKLWSSVYKTNLREKSTMIISKQPLEIVNLSMSDN